MATASLVEYTLDGIPYGVRTLITEKSGPTAVEPLKLAEQTTRGKGFIQELSDGRFRVRAKAQHCGVKNRNNRVYPTRVWEQHLVSGTPFQARIAGRGAIGHLEHPGDGKSQMPLGAIVVTEASPPDENGEVWITFETMSTPPGRVVEAYTRDRVRYGLSSRGNGSVQNRSGVDEVQDDFDPITWDCVIDESTPGAEVPADEHLRESIRKAWAELAVYVKTLNERANGDAGKVRLLAEADARKAAESAIDCPGGVCKCKLTESEMPPSGFSRYLLAFEDGSAHYRAYQGTTGQWEVWMHPHNLQPERLASKIPTLDSCQQVAENHYKLVLAGGAMSAQAHAAQSNAIGREAASLAPNNVQAPNIGGMAGMMGRYSAPVGPGPVTGGRPSKIVLSFESVRPQWQKALAKLQETWKDVMSVPYSGTVMRVTGPDISTLPVLRRAGMVADTISEGATLVYSSFESSKHAVAHVSRVLAAGGVKARVAAVGKIRHGQPVVEGNIMGIMRRPVREAGNDDTQSGDMAGGDTVPEPTGDMPDGISDEFDGEDPMDLDLDLDVNETEGEQDDTDEPAEGDGPDLAAGIDMDEDGETPFDGDMGMGMGDEALLNDMGEPGEEPIDYDNDDNDDLGIEDEPDMGFDDEPFEENSMASPKGMMSEAPSAGQRAMFAKAFGSNKRASVARGNDKYYTKFRGAYAREHGLQAGTASKTGARKVQASTLAGARRGPRGGSVKPKKEARAYFLTFTRRLNEAGGPVAGAVRIWFNEADRPTTYEFYNREGILESIVDRLGNLTHNALAEGESGSAGGKPEVWEGKDGVRFHPSRVIRLGLSEEDLKARHGGATGVAMKGDEYKGKEGPEYSTIDGMNKPGDRGEEGDGNKEGDYDDATSAGDGEVVKTGTWPTSGTPIAMPSEGRRISQRSAAVAEAEDDKKDDDEKEDKKDDDKDESFNADFVSHLREKLAFLEGEVTRYESLCQEQHETIEALRESANQAEMERARAEAFERHPELRRVESRLLRCESVEELNTEVAGLVSLCETRQPAAPPAAPPLVERTNGNGAHSGAPRDGVPVGSLMESSSPFSDRLGTGMRLGNGDVASRVAAHRKRRRGQ
jgi:hypothetical protein